MGGEGRGEGYRLIHSTYSRLAAGGSVAVSAGEAARVREGSTRRRRRCCRVRRRRRDGQELPGSSCARSLARSVSRIAVKVEISLEEKWTQLVVEMACIAVAFRSVCEMQKRG